MSPFSIVIVVKNGARTIGDVLDAVGPLQAEIIIGDTGSTDGTQAIVQAKRYKVHPIDWQGYGAAKNHAASLASNDWILSLDSDEVPDTTLIEALKSLQPGESSVYTLSRLTYIGDQAIRHSGWFPDPVVRLYNKKNICWDNAVVHESLVIPKGYAVQTLQGTLHHYSYADKKEHQQRTARYAHLKATQWIQSGKKPSLLKSVFGPAFRFVKTYFFKSGWRDGSIGYYISRQNANMMRMAIKAYHAKR